MQTVNPWGQQHIASVAHNSAAPSTVPPTRSTANQPPEPSASETISAGMRIAGQDASRAGAAILVLLRLSISGAARDTPKR